VNIFVTNIDPILSAQSLDDSRVVKMTLETAQMLSTVFDVAYRPTHKNHPCVLWARKDYRNKSWLIRHGLGLSWEYTYRFGRVHASHAVIFHVMQLAEALAGCSLSRMERPVEWVVCGDHPYDVGNGEPFLAYQYILNRKWENDKRSPKWTRRGPPSWKDSGSVPGTRAASSAHTEDQVNDTDQGEENMTTTKKAAKRNRVKKEKAEKPEVVKDTFSYSVDWSDFPSSAPSVNVETINGDGGDYPTERGAKRAARQEMRAAAKIIREAASKLRGKKKAK
jgi:hypothetical protein